MQLEMPVWQAGGQAVLNAGCALTSTGHGDQSGVPSFSSTVYGRAVQGEPSRPWESRECSWQCFRKDALATRFISPPTSLILLLLRARR